MTSVLRFRAGRALGLGAAAALVAVLVPGCGDESLPASCVASRENGKYCLDRDDSVLVEDSVGGQVEVFRVVALRDIVVRFPGRETVKVADRGDRGGYVEGEWNLSPDGPAWVGDEAVVRGRAVVSENAFVYGSAEVSGSAQVYGNALVFGNARVLDGAKVYDRAEVYGDAIVFDRAESVFEPDDLARAFCSDLPIRELDFMVDMPRVRHVLAVIAAGEDDAVPPFPIGRPCEEFIEGGRYSFRPTEVFGDARVLHHARVWGGSHIGGHARVMDTSRVSGEARVFGITCGDHWVNYPILLSGQIGC
ncbi:MAG: hypothetical protein F4153_08775 [Acidimicrobiia bacterium]|nr:hypothetical protein [Acidimicrobiia bacterium]